MGDEALREFLAGRVGAWRLRREIEGREAEWLAGEEMAPAGPARVRFQLFPRHLLALCDAVLAGEIAPPQLPPIARRLHRSGYFRVVRSDPDGRVVEEVLAAWTESAGRLRDPEDVVSFREWLLTRRRPERERF